jgi:hypothetical protein
MLFDQRLAVVVPCYNEQVLIRRVIKAMPASVDRIFVVDEKWKPVETRDGPRLLPAKRRLEPGHKRPAPDHEKATAHPAVNARSADLERSAVLSALPTQAERRAAGRLDTRLRCEICAQPCSRLLVITDRCWLASRSDSDT